MADRPITTRRGEASLDEPWCSVLSPVMPHELDKATRKGLQDMVDKVTQAAVHQGQGQDLLLRVYMAGMHHAREALS